MEPLFLILLLVILLGLPLLQMRKQNQRLKQIRSFQDQLAAGMRVKTSSGVYGTILAVGDASVTLEIAAGVHTTWDKLAILELADVESTESAEGIKPVETAGE